MLTPFAARLHAGLPDWMQMKGSTHTYIAPLPENLERGLHRVTVIFEDAYGRVFEETRFFEVL